MIDPSELLFTVDEQNNPIEPQPRNVVHKEGIWHRTSHIWVVNSELQVLCQLRSQHKDSNPGMWEPYFGGHIGPSVDYVQGAISELHEEIGVRPKAEELMHFTVYKSQNNPKNKEFQSAFILKWDGDIQALTLEEKEIDEVKWVDVQVLLDKLKIQDDEWHFAGYSSDILAHIAHK